MGRSCRQGRPGRALKQAKSPPCSSGPRQAGMAQNSSHFGRAVRVRLHCALQGAGCKGPTEAWPPVGLARPARPPPRCQMASAPPALRRSLDRCRWTCRCGNTWLAQKIPGCTLEKGGDPPNVAARLGRPHSCCAPHPTRHHDTVRNTQRFPASAVPGFPVLAPCLRPRPCAVQSGVDSPEALMAAVQRRHAVLGDQLRAHRATALAVLQRLAGELKVQAEAQIRLARGAARGVGRLR